jgi:hypothetical protein
MTLGALKQFFKPDWKKLTLFAVFLFIAFAGNTQTWAFSGRDVGEPKPWFYDLFQGIPFWTIWVFLLLPVLMVSNLIVAVAGYQADFVGRGPWWVMLIIHLVYFYALACLIVFVGDWLIKKLGGAKRDPKGLTDL